MGVTTTVSRSGMHSCLSIVLMDVILRLLSPSTKGAGGAPTLERLVAAGNKNAF
jgi:hypothetical protein